jgi:hypothetical protein
MRLVTTNKRLSRILGEQAAIMDSAQERPGHFKARYTLAELDAIYDASDGTCGICGCVPKEKLALDHDHSTGKIRGLLCMACNTALGKFKDDTSILQRAIEYLRKHGR